MITHRRLGRLLYPMIAITALGLGVYAIARQGEGGQRLAQAPLNIETNIPPALIMALDDSGSMVWELLNNTRDGVYSWSLTRASFYTGSTPNGSGAGQNYHYNFPYAGRDGNLAVPPVPAFGFTRSPDVNPAYFDPRITYDTWKSYDGSDYVLGGINPQSADVDPRSNGSNLTFDLTRQVEQAANNNYRFFVASGMVLSSGTRVYFSANNVGERCAATPQLPDDVYTGWVTLSRNYTLNESCRVGISYFPSTFYLADPATLPASYGYSATPLAITAPQGGRPETLYRYEIRPANFASTSAYNAAMRNFANWFSFYRTRREALIGSLTNSLLDVNNMRVGWFRINNRNTVTMYSLPNDRQSLFSGFYSLGSSGATPTPEAVDWMGQQFQRTDGGAPVKLACQRNAGMLFTDGYINGNRVNRGGNVDGTMGAPFADSFSNTMADNAAYYYNNNVRPDLPAGLVPVPQECATLYDASRTLANQSTDWKRLDCQTNSHMNFYGITLGTQGNIYERNAQSTDDPYAYPPAWESPRDLNPAAVDEMWHATLNARGEMINAKNPALITAAMRRILTSVGSGVTPSGAIGLTGARVGSNSLSVVPRYESRNNGTDWFSTLSASDISTNPVTGILTYTPRWEASSVLPQASARNIWLRTSSGLGRFDSTNVGSLAALCSNTASGQSRCSTATIQSELGVSLDQAVSYLRGDQSLEAGGTLRSRTTRLGDIVNSTPVVSSASDDYGYRALVGGPAGTTPDAHGYSAYLTSKRDRSPYVYVGANDGMLHAFNGRTGVEEFAYIPSTALGHMGNLLFPYNASRRDDQIFRHRYYVDGQITVSDALLANSWKTVLVGSGGAGGRSVFALDVSNPGSFGSGSVLWELSDSVGSNAVRQNIGYVLGRPVIVPVKRNGNVSWKAIFGNGYGSESGVATLFVVDLQSGVVQTLTAQETTNGLPTSNGLGNIVVVDRYTGSSTSRVPDGYADTVYAGDQNGAVWKFDIRANGASPAVERTPFFVATDAAGNRQAITGGLTAARGASGGVMIYFGTGAYSFEQDGTDDSIQTFYGVLDDESGGSVSRANLLQQRILGNVTAADGTISRTVTTNIPTTTQKGWYIDLGIANGNTVVRTGERFVGYPAIESGIVFFSTYQPTITSGCSTVGANRLYGLNTLTGAAALVQVRVGSPTGTSPGTGTGGVALDTGGTAPVKDVAVLSTPRLSPLSTTATPAEQSAALAAQCSMVVQVPGAPPLYLPRPCGRQSWRQVR